MGTILDPGKKNTLLDETGYVLKETDTTLEVQSIDDLDDAETIGDDNAEDINVITDINGEPVDDDELDDEDVIDDEDALPSTDLSDLDDEEEDDMFGDDEELPDLDDDQENDW